MSELVERFQAGDVRALARAISLVERADPDAATLLADLRAVAGPQPPRVGVTGAPGAGKSTLLGAMIRVARRDKRSVAVLAVDPSSPFSGGALLGDRLRMDEHLLDPGVYVRSMGARGQLGGLAPGAAEAAWLLGAHGFAEVLVETVGTGQSELDLPSLVDTTVLVLNPNAGDAIQLEKAGVLEVADVYVVNKTDLPGADRLVRDLHTMLGLGTCGSWVPRVVATVANRPDGSVEQVWDAVREHRAFLADHPEGRALAAGKVRESAAALVAARARAWALAACERDGSLTAVDGRRSPHVIADRLLELAGCRAGEHTSNHHVRGRQA
ncbi:methylmalonyl Co-A mutase-associated GTPase MeaB [Actinophytocola sp.]|uniref:methylmalonyl Co-A mutase-associated GTPase MeaB n=1 Tax=Actinophytocola sp. TaxID=1872138 RepID=UPI002EDAB348